VGPDEQVGPLKLAEDVITGRLPLLKPDDGVAEGFQRLGVVGFRRVVDQEIADRRDPDGRTSSTE